MFSGQRVANQFDLRIAHTQFAQLVLNVSKFRLALFRPHVNVRRPINAQALQCGLDVINLPGSIVISDTEQHVHIRIVAQFLNLLIGVINGLDVTVHHKVHHHVEGLAVIIRERSTQVADEQCYRGLRLVGVHLDERIHLFGNKPILLRQLFRSLLRHTHVNRGLDELVTHLAGSGRDLFRRGTRLNHLLHHVIRGRTQRLQRLLSQTTRFGHCVERTLDARKQRTGLVPHLVLIVRQLLDTGNSVLHTGKRRLIVRRGRHRVTRSGTLIVQRIHVHTRRLSHHLLTLLLRRDLHRQLVRGNTRLDKRPRVPFRVPVRFRGLLGGVDILLTQRLNALPVLLR